MTYLQRAARRLAPVGASVGAAGLRPAIPSRSPLADADQRLNLDFFAERFPAPPVPERGAPTDAEPTSAAQPTATPPSGRQPRSRPEAARRPVPLAPQTAVHSEPRPTQRAGRAVPSPTPTRSDPPVPRPVPGHPEPPVASVRVPDPVAGPPSAVPAAAADEGHAPAAERARAAVVRAAGPRIDTPGPPARDGAPPVLDAVRRALSWVEGEPPRRPEQERDTPVVGARPPFGADAPMPPAHAAERARPPVTHLEIGRIEVEIVPPPQPAPQPAPPRPASRTNGAVRQPFGWRQR